MGSIAGPERVPVLIIGAGPSGALTALHLARLGIRSLVISRHKGCANTPRAHIFNQRAMEVLRDAGLEERCVKEASPHSDMAHSSFLYSLAGEEFARLWAWGNKPSERSQYETASPCSMCDLPQSVLEPIIVDEAKKLGVEFRFYTEFVTLTQSAESVTTRIRDRKGHGSECEIVSEYLLGCDGARSSVVEALGIPIDGQQLNTAFNVHIMADLGKYVADRPGSLNWILNPEAPDWSAVGNFRMVRPWTEWIVSMHPASREGSQPKPDEAAILKRIHQMIGDDTIPVKILSTFQWTINNQVARYWQQDRALCLGDATHRHPPINGLGSNTCISDAFNLAWKLAYVLKGLAHPSLLETLTIERKPVGDAIVQRANEGMEGHRRFWSLIGLTSKARADALRTLKEPGHGGQLARDEWRRCLDLLDLEVQALGIQMNQVYTSSPAIKAEPADTQPDFSALNPLKEVKISTYPGYHLPHAHVAPNGKAAAVSTLDLVGHGKFTLLTGLGGEGWLKASQNIATTTGLNLELNCYSIGFGCSYIDCYGEWERIRGVGESGAVLVRPDHFVAWRCHEVPSDPSSVLREVFLSILQWESKTKTTCL